MSKTYDITSRQVSRIHNAWVYLNQALTVAKEQFKDDSSLVRSITTALAELTPVRSDVVSRKDADMDKLMEMARRIAELNDLHHTVWSIYDMESFSDLSPVYPGCTLISEYNGDDTSVIVKGSTWLDLWIATNELVKKNPDAHGNHIFIEGYKQSPSDPNLFYVYFGS